MPLRPPLPLLTLTLGVLLALVPARAAEATLRFAGAATLEKLIRPLADDIGQAQGVKLQLAPNGTGRGIEDLVAGRAQVAMAAGSLTYFVNLINAKTPGAADAAKLVSHPLFDLTAVIIVHPSNRIAALNHAQIRDLFSGKITNWKELGGPDIPVVIVLPSVSDGIRAVIATQVMAGQPFPAQARVFQTSPELNKVIAQLPGGVSFVSSKMAAPTVRAIKPDHDIVVPFAFVTMGAPSGSLQAVIAALQHKLK